MYSVTSAGQSHCKARSVIGQTNIDRGSSSAQIWSVVGVLFPVAAFGDNLAHCVHQFAAKQLSLFLRRPRRHSGDVMHKAAFRQDVKRLTLPGEALRCLDCAIQV